MTARAITTHARAVLVLASCAALLPAVQSLPTRAPTAKPTAFMPLPPLPTLAPSSSPAAGSDDGMSSSTSPTAYRDLNPPRPTYADRDALEPLSFPPTVPPSSIATEDEDEEHTAECPNRERGCEECSLNGDKWKISSYLTCPNRQSCHGIRDDEVLGTRTRFCVCNPLLGLAASGDGWDGATECSRWTSTTWVMAAAYFLLFVINVWKVVGGVKALKRVFNARAVGVIGPKGGGPIRPKGCLKWMISEPMSRVLVVTVFGQAGIALMMAMEFFETTGWLSGTFGPWPFRHQYIETLYNIFQLIMYLILLLIGMIWIEVRAQFGERWFATARMPL